MAAAAAHQSIRLRLRCDYPQKDAVIQLPTGATVADLKEAAESSLEMSQAELARYDWVVVPFGRDLRTLAGVADTAGVTAAGVEDSSTVLLSAPASKRPGVDGIPAPSLLAMKSFGFTARNVLDIFAGTKTDPETKEAAFEFINLNAEDVLATSGWLAAPPTVVQDIVQSPTLCIDEVRLFEAVVQWGRAECARRKQPSDGAPLREAVKEAMKHIRFPLMTTIDIATRVNPCGALENAQTLQIFTYLGATGAGASGDAIPIDFPKQPRLCKTAPLMFRFEEPPAEEREEKGAKAAAMGTRVALSQNRATADVSSGSDATRWVHLLGSRPFRTGVHEFKLELERAPAALAVGFAPEEVAAAFVGADPANRPVGVAAGWGFWLNAGLVSHNGAAQGGKGVALELADGMKVSVRLDLNSRLFTVSAGDQPPALCMDLQAPLVPVFSLMGSARINLLFASNKKEDDA